MPVTTYSLAADGDKKLSPNFRVREFACHDGSDRVLISSETVVLLEQIRAYYRQRHPGATVVLNSGYRTPAYNRRIGGAADSQHCKGTAADFTVRIPGGGIVPPLQVYNDIDKGLIVGRHDGGLGKYATFTHIDTRAGRARWKG